MECCNIKLAFRCFQGDYLLRHNDRCRGIRTQRGSIHRYCLTDALERGRVPLGCGAHGYRPSWRVDLDEEGALSLEAERQE